MLKRVMQFILVTGARTEEETVSTSEQSKQTEGVQHHADAGLECSCLNWKDAYRSKQAFCGQGPELLSLASDSHVSSDVMLPFVQLEYCGDFFERLDHSHCVLLQQGLAERDQQHNTWCYVSPLCPNLNRGANLARGGASWKTCSAHEDSILRNVSLPALSAIAEAGGVDLGLLVRLAYPVQPQRWPEVEQHWWFADLVGQPESVSVAMTTRSPVIYEVLGDGSGDKVLAVGEQLWAVNLDSARYPRTRFRHECMLGCENLIQTPHKQTPQRGGEISRRTSSVPYNVNEASGNAACRCLNWKEAYASGSVSCGQGQELYPFLQTSDLSWDQALPFVGDEMCTDFYEKLDHNSCVPLSPEISIEGRDDQWCYVSTACMDLNGGAHVQGRAVSWKMCAEKTPTQSSSLIPAQNPAEKLLVDLVLADQIQASGLKMLSAALRRPQLRGSAIVVADRQPPVLQARSSGQLHDPFLQGGLVFLSPRRQELSLESTSWQDNEDSATKRSAQDQHLSVQQAVAKAQAQIQREIRSMEEARAAMPTSPDFDDIRAVLDTKMERRKRSLIPSKPIGAQLDSVVKAIELSVQRKANHAIALAEAQQIVQDEESYLFKLIANKADLEGTMASSSELSHVAQAHETFVESGGTSSPAILGSEAARMPIVALATPSPQGWLRVSQTYAVVLIVFLAVTFGLARLEVSWPCPWGKQALALWRRGPATHPCRWADAASNVHVKPQHDRKEERSLSRGLRVPLEKAPFRNITPVACAENARCPAESSSTPRLPQRAVKSLGASVFSPALSSICSSRPSSAQRSPPPPPSSPPPFPAALTLPERVLVLPVPRRTARRPSLSPPPPVLPLPLPYELLKRMPDIPLATSSRAASSGITGLESPRFGAPGAAASPSSRGFANPTSNELSVPSLSSDARSFLVIAPRCQRAGYGQSARPTTAPS